MMHLKTVRVTKKDSCLTYVFKRIGVKSFIEYAKDIPKEALIPFSLENVYIGQILVWKSRKSYYLWNTEIMSFNGKPVLIKNNEFAGLHFAVVEHIEIINDTKIITVSDCVRNGNSHSFPTIELGTISLTDTTDKTELKLPTYYLDYEQFISN